MKHFAGADDSLWGRGCGPWAGVVGYCGGGGDGCTKPQCGAVIPEKLLYFLLLTGYDR